MVGRIAAVDGGASGRVGDDQPIAEELGEQFDVRRFAATGACSGELKQRLLHLHFAHVISRNLAAIHFRNRKKEIPIGPLGFTQRQLRLHVDGFQSRFGLVARRANIDADPAAGAIFHRHLQRVFQALSTPAAAPPST